MDELRTSPIPRSDRLDPEVLRQQILHMEEGEGAGPGAPETVEPVLPRTDGAHRVGEAVGRPPRWRSRTGSDDAGPSPSQAVAGVTWLGTVWIRRVAELLRARAHARRVSRR